MATVDDVAKAAGVSISTVSYALSGKRSISQTTRQRVLKAAAELDYHPRASARMLAANRSQILAVTAPLHADTDHSVHMQFAMEVTKEARSLDYDTLLLVHDDPMEGMRRSAATALADGVVVLDVDAHDPRADLARTMDYPVVFVGIPEQSEGLMCVDLDFEAAARLAVDRLIEAGHSSIGMISHPRITIERESNFPLRFLAAFEEHCRARGIAHAVAYPDGNHSAVGPVDELLRTLPDMTALVLNTSSDVANSALPALFAHGITVPHDMSVIAAGAAYPTHRLSVPLDRIPLDAHASCAAAVDLLVAAIDRGMREARTVLIAPEYQDFGSVRAPAPRAEKTAQHSA
ncbi:LacI family DNA-binding transcriptional regulator [Demequina zhanjiangensis]|uniref:LacI family DNA-binding transcriptional regulator n=1 Tax=Demequina zhanjiangensis TaxID=3051659 RepID=A0ABT8FZ91_9MICO|nr:LacI family DNA-binding transcriptional regulator [Demequina sp. SYSU T00b26]MDN4472214.1 LacI family DNA-binding transcriptional regulator [Demequina sp. SYSU T00b26]